jgi:hypothetical protein
MAKAQPKGDDDTSYSREPVCAGDRAIGARMRG